jgi:hypothetical protein
MNTESVLTKLVPHQVRANRHSNRIPTRSQDGAYGSSSKAASRCALSNFISISKPWSRERVSLPRSIRGTVWALFPMELFWVIWLATIVTGATSCRKLICTVATLDHHAAELLVCGVFCVAVLAGLIPSTRGFSKCNGIEVIGLAIALAAGAVALLGIAALMIAAVIALIVLATFLLAFTATSRRETHDARPRTPFPIAPAGGANPFRAHRVERPD